MKIELISRSNHVIQLSFDKEMWHEERGNFMPT